MVVWSEHCTRPALKRALEQVRAVGGKLTGVVLNKVDLKRNAYYYGQYYGEYYRRYYAEGEAAALARASRRGAPASRRAPQPSGLGPPEADDPRDSAVGGQLEDVGAAARSWPSAARATQSTTAVPWHCRTSPSRSRRTPGMWTRAAARWARRSSRPVRAAEGVLEGHVVAGRCRSAPPGGGRRLPRSRPRSSGRRGRSGRRAARGPPRWRRAPAGTAIPARAGLGPRRRRARGAGSGGCPAGGPARVTVTREPPGGIGLPGSS